MAWIRRVSRWSGRPAQDGKRDPVRLDSRLALGHAKSTLKCAGVLKVDVAVFVRVRDHAASFVCCLHPCASTPIATTHASGKDKLILTIGLMACVLFTERTFELASLHVVTFFAWSKVGAEESEARRDGTEDP